MRSVSVDSLEPGMTLAKPLSKGNMVILGEGTVLTRAWIDRIEDMGIEQIYVEGTSAQAISIEDALGRLDARFRNTISEPYMRDIKKSVETHIKGLYA